jgi:diaminohydroxyphosphoribosylaminopyrimidine deaminase/5-amino-6-(5-phosphoribosylamino)uracil reductase
VTTDRGWLEHAVALAWRCPPVTTAFSVGACLVDAGGALLAEGWSRELDPLDHAEEGVLAKLGPAYRAAPGTTLYSSLEPCSVRASRPRTCTELILAARVPRVVFAWREPELFVHGEGAERLRAAGVEVVELAELAEAARDVNLHLPV